MMPPLDDDDLGEEARGLRADVQRLTNTVRLLVWVVAVQTLLVAALAGLVVFLFVTRDTTVKTLKAGTATLGILQGCLSPGPRTPTLDDPRTGNACFDQITQAARDRTADVRLSIDCGALYVLGDVRASLDLPADPLSPRCSAVVQRIEGLRSPS